MMVYRSDDDDDDDITAEGQQQQYDDDDDDSVVSSIVCFLIFHSRRIYVLLCRIDDVFSILAGDFSESFSKRIVFFFF